MLTTPAANLYTEGLAGVGKGQDNSKDKKNQGKAKMKEDKRTKKDTKSSSSTPRATWTPRPSEAALSRACAFAAARLRAAS